MNMVVYYNLFFNETKRRSIGFRRVWKVEDIKTVILKLRPISEPLQRCDVMHIIYMLDRTFSDSKSQKQQDNLHGVCPKGLRKLCPYLKADGKSKGKSKLVCFLTEVCTLECRLLASTSAILCAQQPKHDGCCQLCFNE